MRGTVLYAPRDVRFEQLDDPKITEPTDAIIQLSATCVCGSDLWPYRGISPVTQPTPFGHEYCGIVEEVGSGVESIKPGQFVIGSFFASDNTCPHCQAGFQSSCQHRELIQGAQAEWLRVPLADGTLVVRQVHWSQWGGRVAIGRGTAEYHGCTPQCGTAPIHHAGVTVHLYGIRDCGGQNYYNRAAVITFQGKKLSPRYQHWAPC